MYGNEHIAAWQLSGLFGWFHRLQSEYSLASQISSTRAHALCAGHSGSVVGREPPRSLAQTLVHCQYGNCSNFHDQIYALRSVFANSHCFPVNYAIGKWELLLEVLIFCCEELFVRLGTDSISDLLSEYSKARDIVFNLLGIAGLDVLSGFTPRASKTLSLAGVNRLPFFYLDLSGETPEIELDDTVLQHSEPHKASSERQLKDRIAEHFGMEATVEDGVLEWFSGQRLFGGQLHQRHPPVKVYSLKSAALIIFSVSPEPSSIHGIMRFETLGNNVQRVYTSGEIYGEALNGVKIVSSKTSKTQGAPKPGPHLLFDATQSGVLAGGDCVRAT